MFNPKSPRRHSTESLQRLQECQNPKSTKAHLRIWCSVSYIVWGEFKSHQLIVSLHTLLRRFLHIISKVLKSLSICKGLHIMNLKVIMKITLPHHQKQTFAGVGSLIISQMT